MPLETPPHGAPSNAAFIPQCLAHPTSCSVAATIVEALRLALAAAPAAMCVLPNKGSCNTQHLEAGKTARSVTGTVPPGRVAALLMEGMVLFALSFLLPPDRSAAKAHRRS